MALLFIQNNLYYSCELLYADGRCFSRIFTGAPLKAREAALTYLLEQLLDDDARNDAYLIVSAHHLKTGEKATVTSTALLRQPHEGLQQELDLYEREGVKTEKVLFSFHQPQYINLLLSGTNTRLLKNENTLLGIAQDWTITFGRKKTRHHAFA